MKTDKKILAVFGDSKFPIKSSSYGELKYKDAVSKIVMFLKEASPDRVYTIPDNTTSILTALVAIKLKIRTTLVGPFPGFFNILSAKDRRLLKLAVRQTDSFILMEDSSAEGDIEHLRESIEFCLDVANGIAFFRSQWSTSQFTEFMDGIPEANNKTLFELVYDGRR